MKIPKLTEKQAWKLFSLHNSCVGQPCRRIKRGVYEEDGEVFFLKDMMRGARDIVREAFQPDSIGELEPSQINRILGRKVVKVKK